MSRFWLWILDVITMLGVLVMGSLLMFAIILVHSISRPHNPNEPEIFAHQLPTAGATPPHFKQRPLLFQADDGVILRGYFLAQPHPAPTIIIHSFSMGAAVALLIPPRPEVAAINADSPYARLDDILRCFVVCKLTEREI